MTQSLAQRLDRLERMVSEQMLAEPPAGVLSVKGAAKYLSVSVSQMYNLTGSGQIPTVVLSQGTRKPRIGVAIADLDEYVRKHRHVPRGWE